jgi:P-type conjugative transfer protein TrbL
MKKLIFLAIAGIATNAFAGVCAVQPGGIAGFDAILNTYSTIAFKWSGLILPKATTLFWILFALEFFYQLIFKKIIAFDIQRLYVFLVVRIFTGYMFANVFLNISFYQGIITYFTKLGSDLGGSTIALSGGAAGMAISPSAIVNYLECQYAIPAATLATASFSPLGGQFFSMMLFAILILIISIPITLMITMIDAYVVIFGGFILCGFSGSSWTQNYWQKYFSYVGGVAIRLFITCLILGMVIQSFSVLDKIPLNVSSPSSIITYVEALLGLLFFNVVALITIPNKAASMLNGSINSGLGEVIGGASMMMAGMRGISGITESIKGLGSGATNTPVMGKTATAGKAQEIFNNGTNNGSSSQADWKSIKKNGDDISVNDGWKNTTNSSSKTALKEFASSAKHAGGLSNGHSGAAELNVNPHKEE